MVFCARLIRTLKFSRLNIATKTKNNRQQEKYVITAYSVEKKKYRDL